MFINPTDSNNNTQTVQAVSTAGSGSKIQAGPPDQTPAVSNNADKQGNEDSQKSSDQKMSLKEAQSVVDSLSSYLEIMQTSLGFHIKEKSDKVVVTITNQKTNEVIRQIPSEELLALQEKMKELTGIIFSEIA